MKKTLAVILVAVLLLSTLVSLVVPAAAADEGDWDVMLTASAADADDPDKNPPLAGYYYDETGFHSVSPNYANYNPKFSVVSKEMYNIKDFSMTIVVHDYCTSGDNWLSFTLWSDCNGFAQGDTSGKYGDGWTSLIRAGGDGNVNRFESWNQTKGGRSGKQSFTNIDGTQLAPVVFEPIVDEATGDFTITFAITDGVMSVNGSVVGSGTDKLVAERFKEGLAYVGVTIHNTDASGNYFPTISIKDVNGSVPTGSDSRAAESKERVFGEEIDPSTVPEYTPAIWFDGSLEATNTKLPTGSNCDITFADDNQSIKVTAEAEAFYMQFEIPDAITYNADHFGYIAFIFKNFCTCTVAEGESLNDACSGAEMGSIWYCAGEVTSPRNDCAGPIATYYWVTPTDEDGNVTSDDYYTVAVFPIMNEFWTGRIHGFRMDVGAFKNYGVEGQNTYEIMGAGVFKSGSDVTGFVKNFRNLGLNTEWLEIDYPLNGEIPCYCFDGDDDGLCDYCGKPVEVEDTTEEDTTVEDTTEEVTTKKPAEVATEAPAATEEKKGCGATVSMSVLSLVALAGAGMVSFKKKEN